MCGRVLWASAVPVAERPPAIRDGPLGRRALWSPKRNPPASSKGAVSGGTGAGLLAVCPARIIHRDRDALRNTDFDLSTVVCP